MLKREGVVYMPDKEGRRYHYPDVYVKGDGRVPRLRVSG